MKTDNLIALQAQTRFILQHAYRFDWSLQGFGLLRLYLPGDARLHIWDHSYAYYDVSQLHDHLQWGLTSTIVSGRLENQRYAELPTERDGVPIQYIFSKNDWKEWNYATFKAGYGAHKQTKDGTILLKPNMPETYLPGDSYHQEPSEVHKTTALPGTVTVMQKYPTSTESARIFWPVGTEWVSAEPRKATTAEIRAFAAKALELLDAQAA